MASVAFTGNYQDLSSSKGFQFKFFCEKCQNGYLSTFKPNKLGMASAAAGAAASLLGGIFGRAAASAQQLESMVAGPAHDTALKEATEEIRRLFKQCSRCGQYVCGPVCWNETAGLCETCAPDIREEVAAAQAQAARAQAGEKAQAVDWMKDQKIDTVVAAVCPKCNAKTQGSKFCPECGTAIAQKRKCAACGAEAQGTPKFCPECGKPYN